MKGTHPTKWQGTAGEKVSPSVHSEDSNNNIIETLAEEMEHEADMDVDMEFEEADALSELNSHAIEPLLALQDEIQWRGIPLQKCSLDGKRHYKCVKCMYINSSAANAANHSQQHGQNRKYKCSKCDYSVDNFKHMQSHIDNIHNREPTFKTTRSSIMTDFPTEPTQTTESAVHTEEVKSVDQHVCPKCPFRTRHKMKLQIHMERHSARGRFQCQLCDFSVDNYGHLRRHARLHSTTFSPEGQPIQSEEPLAENDATYEDEEFSKRWTANNFPEKRNPEKYTFRCGACPFFTSKKAVILKHRLNHINKSPFACQSCTFSTNNTRELEDHVGFHGDVQLPSDHMEFIVEPTSEMYKVIEKFPDDEDTVDDDKMMADEAEENMDVDDVEDDLEAAMMEEELRDTITGRDNLDKDDVDLQFRNYKCTDCPYSSNSNAEYTKHLRLHGTDKRFKCDFCTYSLDRVNLISQHRKLHFQEKNFEYAPLISKLLNKKHEEYESMVIKVGKEMAYPPVESATKVTDDQIDMYLYQNPGDDKNRYLCNKCPYKCQALKSFKCHLQMHGINRKYKCDYCDWSTERLNLLIQHRRVHSSEKEFDPAPGELHFLNREFFLETADQTEAVVGMTTVSFEDTQSATGDKLEKKTISGEKIYHCKLCPFQSENMNTYSYHKKLHCIQAKYSCSECSYSINNHTSLNEHINLHQKERELIKASLTEGGVKHKCPKCPFSIPNKNLLVNHTSMHGSGRKHECSKCDFSCDAQTMLMLHSKVHDDSYTGSDSMEEMEHLMKRRPDMIGPQLYLSTSNLADIDSDCSDSADPDHKCEKCPYSTPSKDELTSHDEHHNVHSKNSCMYCTYSCSKEDELINHVQVHFPSTTVDRDLLKLLKRQGQSHKRNISKAFNDGEEGDNQVIRKDGEPDSTTINEPSKGEKKAVKLGEESETKEVEKTKVYVCQYCEREFDNKTTMLQHEKNHQV